VVLLQPTSPLRSPADISGAVDLHFRSGLPVVSVTELPEERIPTYALDGTMLRHLPRVKPNGAVYVAQSLSLLFGDWYGPTTVGYLMPPERSIDIDTSDDLNKARELMA
jgi:CMP-N,N'-diacetyllegionaminic acid synthase